ncbi:MAG: hypothetical protein U1F76_07505 [Candidatus Competibacteraceae bacterium]
MARSSLGKLPKRYSFMLNPYTDTRLSRCPKCNKLTQLRKFALFIHIEQWGPLILGKTCRYCSHCELIMAHKNELEAQLAHSFSRLAPEVIGNEYLVMGTMDKKSWQASVGGPGQPLSEALKHVAEFKHYYDLEYKPMGRYPADDDKSRK